MAKERLGDKPLGKKDKLDWIGEGAKGKGEEKPEKQESKPIYKEQQLELEVTPAKKKRAERLSIVIDPDLADEFNKLCDMWRAAYPNTQKKDVCNKMVSEFNERYGEEIKKRLSQVLES